jgi:O-antigen ligase
MLSKKYLNSHLFVSSLYFAIIMTVSGHLLLKKTFLWGVGAGIVFVAILYILEKRKINKIFFNTILINSSWLIYALFTSYGIISLELHLKSIFETLLYILIIAIIFNNVKELKNIFKIIIFSMYIYLLTSLIVVGLLAVGVDINGSTYAFSSISDNRNTYVMINLFYLIILIYMPTEYKNQFLARFNFLLILMFILLSLLTLSTNGLLSIIIIISMSFTHKYGKLKMILIFPILAILLSFLLFLFPQTLNRTLDKVDSVIMYEHADLESKRHSSAGIRLYLAINAFQVFLEHPIKGVGVNNGQFYLESPANILAGKEKNYNSENNYSEMLLNGGIVAFLLYYVPIILLLYNLIRIDKNHPLYNIRNMIITLLIIKLFSDIGLKSYNHFGHPLILVLSWIIYLRFIKIRNTCK